MLRGFEHDRPISGQAGHLAARLASGKRYGRFDPFTVGPLLGVEGRIAFFEIGLISTTHYFLKQPVNFIREADPAGPVRARASLDNRCVQ